MKIYFFTFRKKLMKIQRIDYFSRLMKNYFIDEKVMKSQPWETTLQTKLWGPRPELERTA
jgi:hypothetical protein